MNVKINIDKEMSVMTTLSVVVISLLIVMFLMVVLFEIEITFKTGIIILLIIAASAFLIVYLIEKFVADKSVYLSDLVITDTALLLLYSKMYKVVREERVLSYDIESVKAKVSAYISRGSRTPPTLNGNAVVVITLRDGHSISFKIPSDANVFDGIFKMNKNRAYIPGFSYEIKSDDENALKYARHFIEHGKMPPASAIEKRIIAFFVILFIGTLIIAVFFMIRSA